MPVTPKLVEDFFGQMALARLVPADFTIGTTAARIVVANTMRRWVSISNFGTALVIVAPRPSVTTTAGIPIGSGDTLIMSWFDDFALIVLDWYAISSAAGQAVHVEDGLGEFNAPQ